MELRILETTKKGRNAYEDNLGNVYLDCKTCDSIKREAEFCVSSKRFRGRGTNCKECNNKRIKKWYGKDENKCKAIERATKWNRDNKHRKPKPTAEELKRISQERYERSLYSGHIYRARKRNLVNDFDNEDYTTLMNMYKGKCCLTGSTNNLHLDHVIPLATGHSGTVYENIIPLASTLNSSKQAYNIFEWAESNYSRLGFTLEQFYEVMTEVAKRNSMTLEKYREYYYWCFENPKKVPTHYNNSSYYISFTNRLNEAIKMYKAGATKKEITDYTNLSESTLYKHLKIRSVETRKPSLCTLENRLDKAIQLYQDGVKIHEIYKKTSIHKKTLFNTIHKLGIPTRIPNRFSNNRHRIDIAIQMYLQGEGIHNILSKARIGKKLLYDTIDELELPRRRNRGEGNS